MIKSGFGFIALALVLFCCDNIADKKREGEFIAEKVLYHQNAISQLLDSLRPPIQRFSINGKKDTVVVGSVGILVAISSGTFSNSKGEIVSGKIHLNLVEVKSFPDIISAGLQTTSGERILQTAGMIFIDALSKGESLQIRPGKSIVMKMSGQRSFINAKVFTGEFNEDGNMNWKKVSGMETDLIPFPIDLLDFNNGAWECWYSEEQLRLLQDTKFKNTYIHTTEFESRMHIFNYYATCPQMNDLDDEIIKIYTDNISHDLFYADSLAALHLINNYKPLVDTTKVFRFDNVGWISFIYRSALQFAEERLGKPLDFDALGIDSTSTLKQLIDRGYSETEATHVLNLYNIRERAIKLRRDQQEVSELHSYVFSVTNLGWINVDRFLTDQESSESTFTVSVNSRDSLDVFVVSLIIPSYSVALNATNETDGSFSFTKKEEGYRKLPVGEEAIIMALSYKNTISYFGKKKIKIPKDGRIELQIEETSQDEIRRSISSILDQ